MKTNIKTVFEDSKKLFEDARKSMRNTAILTAKIVLNNVEGEELNYEAFYGSHDEDVIFLENDDVVTGIYLNVLGEPYVHVQAGPYGYKKACYAFSELNTKEVCEIATYLCHHHSDKM